VAQPLVARFSQLFLPEMRSLKSKRIEESSGRLLRLVLSRSNEFNQMPVTSGIQVSVKDQHHLQRGQLKQDQAGGD
jgi:hypothetical protein